MMDERIFLSLVLFLAVVCVIAAFVLLDNQQKQFADSCHARGGAVQHIYRNANCVSTDGKLLDTFSK